VPDGSTEDETVNDTAVFPALSVNSTLSTFHGPAEVRFVHLMHHHTDSGRISLFFEVTRWEGEPDNREPDKCARWDWFTLTDLPADMISYTAHALAHYTKGEVYTERGWEQPYQLTGLRAARMRLALPDDQVPDGPG
jgi:8-oxo-dGTP diphosphatase